MSDKPSVIQIKKPLSFSEKFRSKNAPTIIIGGHIREVDRGQIDSAIPCKRTGANDGAILSGRASA